MPTVRIEIRRNGRTVGLIEPDRDVVRVGRSPHNDIVVDSDAASPEHFRIVLDADGVYVEDAGSEGGTLVLRPEGEVMLDTTAPRIAARDGDVLAFAPDGARAASLELRIEQDVASEHIVEMRPIEHLATTRGPAEPERSATLLSTLHAVQQAIGRAEGLDDVLCAVADAALALLPRATHATLVLREESAAAAPASAGNFAPRITRVRGRGGAGVSPAEPVRVARSIFRKVVQERAAVIAADAPREELSTESLLGASIRSTIGVPLWKGGDLIGVLQVDNRDAPAMFDSSDVDVLAVLAVNASLAVANARLIKRLMLAEEQLSSENRFLRTRDRERRAGTAEIVGNSPPLMELLRQIDKVADTRATVLIQGETGTGKELAANAIHERSRRRDRLFVAQNCAALPETLLESELFGHKRGAFTGATEEKKGLFELADGGTLFLDEVTELPLGLQAKLLRVLQEGEIRRVGATQTKYVDVRIVAATNADLAQEVAEGRFREDLFYRLKVFPLQMPALRDRKEDIPRLVEHFLQRHSRDLAKGAGPITPEAMGLLQTYPWPGNIRELSNEVQRMVILAEPGEPIGPELLSAGMRAAEGALEEAGAVTGSLREMMEQVEKHLIAKTLREHGNNKTNAAKTLGITREGLHKKLRALKLG